MKLNPYLFRIFSVLPLAHAWDLHKRLKAGRTDPETRRLLRKVLAPSRQVPKVV